MYEQQQTIQLLVQIISTPLIDSKIRGEASKKLNELVKAIKVYK